MTPAIGRSFEKLEQQKSAALAAVSTWPAERMCFQPGTGCWSALQVFDHLVKVEAALLSNVRSNLPDGHSQSVSDSLRTLLVLRVMRSPMRVKVPLATLVVLPGATPNPTILFRQWGRIRRHLASLLEALPSAQRRRGLFQHPVGGWMTMLQALSFLSAHLQHHGYQLKRLERASRHL